MMVKLRKSHLSGFTLFEMLIALTIFAICAVALSGTFESNIANQARLEEKTIASWIAQNKLVELRALRVFPDLGRSEDRVSMASRDWLVKTQVKKTLANLPGFREVHVEVYLMETIESEERESFAAEIKTYAGAYK